MKLTLSFLLAAGAMAACPNACSKHGECGEYDSCNCHAGFQGGDCSERVCMYNWAWVTTAQGDLNFDGDRYDGTVYSTTTAIEPSIANTVTTGYGGQVLLTQAAPGGTWESWPYYGTAQEGHYYMECSNRGICDRTKGDCVCFEGYTGTACNRMACPESCSEHGVCQTVLDFDSTYKLWDKNMARACKCDPGYTGPACQTRECPFGNDPLTKTNEIWEVQYVDIFSKCEGSLATTGTCGTVATDTAQLGGYVRLSYTDHHGETYKTAPVQVQVMDGSAAATTVATNVQTALRALPNNVISQTLTVTPEYCETTVDVGAASSTAGALTGTVVPTGVKYRFLDSASNNTESVFNPADGKVVVSGPTTSQAPTEAMTGYIAAGTYTISALATPICIRLKVTFDGMPGNLNALAVDHDLVTYFDLTNSQDVGANVGSDVTSMKDVTGGNGITLTTAYTKPSTVVYTGTKNGQIAVAGTVTFNETGILLQGATTAFHPNSKVKIECLSEHNDVVGSTANQWRHLGFYTVSADTVPTTDVLTLKENIASNQCTAAQSSIRITQISNIITIGDHDLSKTATFGPGDRIAVTSDDSTYIAMGTTVQSVEYHSGVSGTGTSEGFIIFVGEDSDMWSAAVSGTWRIVTRGDGTRENVECSDRGICQEDGTCKCFKGYTSDSCSEQKAIAA